MAAYTLFPNDDKKQTDGNNITSTSTKVDGGTGYGLGTAVASGSALSANVKYGAQEILGNVIKQSKDLFGVFHTSTISITSVADNGSGKARFTKTGHGLLVGTVINVSGSTSGNVDGVQEITAVTSNTFDTDKKYTAAATAGSYARVAGNFAKLTAGAYVLKAYSTSVAGGQATLTGFGTKYSNRRSIAKLEGLWTRRVATAIRAGYWNIFTGTWSTEPTTANDISTIGTDDAATPTLAKPGELVYRVSGQPDGTYGVIQKDYPAKNNG